MSSLPPLPPGFQLEGFAPAAAAPVASGAPAAPVAPVPALPPGFQIEAPATSSGAATPPPGLVPGSAAYRDWAVQQVLAGNSVPQVSPTPPPSAPQTPSYTPSVLGPAYDAFDATANNLVDGIWIAGPTLTKMGDAFDAGVNNLMGFQPETAQDRAQVDQAQAQHFPLAAGAGSVAGTVLPAVAAGGIPAVAEALGMEGPMAARIGLGATSMGTIGDVDAQARGSSPTDAAYTGAADAAMGGVAPVVGAMLSRAMGAGMPVARSLIDLMSTKNAAYDAADAVGARYTPQAYRDMVANLVVDANADHLSPGVHPHATAVLSDMAQKATDDPTYSPTLSQMDQWRQVIERDVGSGTDGEGHFGRMFKNGIDDFIDNATPAQMASGDPHAAADAIQQARGANSTFMKTQQVAQAMDKADLRAASTGSGGNIDNATRQNLRAILDSGARGYTPEEKSLLEQAVRGGPVQNTLRLLGKMSPEGNGLMAFMEMGGAIGTGEPKLLAVPAMGFAAKRVADAMSEHAAQMALAKVSQGGKAVPMTSPVLNALIQRTMPALPLLENQSAGDPGPIVQALVQAAEQQ